MAFSYPAYGVGPDGGSPTSLPKQPSRAEVTPASLQGRRDQSGVFQGYDTLTLYWSYLTNSQYQTLMGHWNTARGNGGRCVVQFFEDESNSMVTVNALMYRPTYRAMPGGDTSGPNRQDVQVSFLVGLP